MVTGPYCLVIVDHSRGPNRDHGYEDLTLHFNIVILRIPRARTGKRRNALSLARVLKARGSDALAVEAGRHILNPEETEGQTMNSNRSPLDVRSVTVPGYAVIRVMLVVTRYGRTDSIVTSRSVLELMFYSF